VARNPSDHSSGPAYQVAKEEHPSTLLVVGRRHGRASPYVALGDVVECEADHRLALFAVTVVIAMICFASAIFIR